jgi:arabinose-5-phosphate isomerase
LEAQIKNSLIQTLQIEAQALLNIVNAIDHDTISSIKAMYHCKGKIVFTGIGKSGLIAQKIVATLNSTGSKAIFMHAADAIHGDLGIIDPQDIIVAISKSGDTSEVKVLVPIIKHLGNKLIAMVSNDQSFLFHQADFKIYIPISLEADPNILAPTSSTTAQLAMGDAIAIALLNLRGFSDQDFARLHPGGIIGKVLYTKVNDISYKNEKPCINVEETLPQIINSISSGRLGATAVVDNNQSILGIITDGDLRRMIAHGINSNIKANSIMTHNPKTIDSDDLAANALIIMQENKISQLLVTKNSKYVGIIHLHDLIREGII